MGKRNRRRREARRKPTRDPKPVILVVTEGSVTEPEYLHGFVDACRNPRVRIDVNEGAGDPRSIVEYAREMKDNAEDQARGHSDENMPDDEVWCVFDVDDHARIGDARQMARDNGLDLAVSNPCIELWLLLHFREQPGMKDRNALLPMLRRHIRGYDKHVRYADYADGYASAVDRASRLDADAADHGEVGPTAKWGVTQQPACGGSPKAFDRTGER